MKRFQINKSGDVELRLDDKRVLLISAADDGIVLDVWEDGGMESQWSSWFTYDEMTNDLEE